tara:strand:- start:190 stop:618 length:429 start_codon:yes stop_codon:yes gene_type:complete
MPLYEGECNSGCGRFEDVLTVQEYTDKGLICPECSGKARTVLFAAPTVGPMPSKPLVIEQIGRTFSSRTEERRYFEQNPGRTVVAPNDAAFINHRDKAREKAESKAKLLGFRDHDDRTKRTKAEIAKKKKIAKGEGKIYNIA